MNLYSIRLFYSLYAYKKQSDQIIKIIWYKNILPFAKKKNQIYSCNKEENKNSLSYA